jgi:hypothetical protein
MNSPILPVDGPSDLSSRITSAVPTDDDIGAFIAELAVGENALSIAAQRGGPPHEVLDQIAAAGRIEETMRADGQRLRFDTAPGQPTRIKLDERETVRTLSVGEAFDIATGASPR